jgi:large conductance mechanosensitive channel
MRKLIQEFRDFAMRGNVLDMAVGIIIGAAFTTVVKSLVDDVLMPPIGMVVGGMDFSDLAITLREAHVTDAGKQVNAATIGYGKFIGAAISFAITAFAVFLIVKAMNVSRRRQATAPAAPPAPPAEVVLLSEIRDLLKARG